MLVEDFKKFLKCGGIIQFSEWFDMDDVTKAALNVAADELRAEDALMIGAACRSVEGALDVSARLDGGKRMVRHRLMDAVHRYMDKRRRPK
jgi:hypothetical protein